MWWIRKKEDKVILVINKREGRACLCGKYLLGYRDKGRAVAALVTSQIMAQGGLKWSDFELVNEADNGP